MANPPTGSIEALATRSVVTLPTMWKVVIGVGSLASTAIVLVVSISFQLAKAEWAELRGEVRDVRAKVDTAATGAQVERLTDDLRALEHRVTRVEVQCGPR